VKPQDRRRAYSHGRGESVTRNDRQRRELRFESPSPPLARPCESTARPPPWVGQTVALTGFDDAGTSRANHLFAFGGRGRIALRADPIGPFTPTKILKANS